MAAVIPQWVVVDFPAGVREDPRVLEAGILELATKAEVGFGDLGLGILEGLLGPGLDIDEVEDRETECRA
ncbi:hypothetical protein CDL15_Pgr019086 [Punica granatum]|uniref:Uncharacterized protein n=1 Tax=Punica granatum TaxID=22663 RepID=A0A218XME2_PUNGR|nr:hypothetical protein CDL15_Pgr019086 [Punica granatum]